MGGARLYPPVWLSADNCFPAAIDSLVGESAGGRICADDRDRGDREYVVDKVGAIYLDCGGISLLHRIEHRVDCQPSVAVSDASATARPTTGDLDRRYFRSGLVDAPAPAVAAPAVAILRAVDPSADRSIQMELTIYHSECDRDNLDLDAGSGVEIRASLD